ncbi:MAG: Spy/CpxP family protein refolding chaperone [Oscillatoriaceae cyanobacterium Prado104]|jgi:Spy/CpxP family protein refolding chaperone|nr:Spy/CpxP family protein refolding chaperone [Oscillatoriaceae cyanobacterium Prado104]
MSISRISAIAMLMFAIGSTGAAIAVPNPALSQTIAQNQQQNQRGGKEGRLFEQLNLTAEQKQRMQAVRDRYKDQLSQRRQAVRQARQELENMMSGNQANASQMRDKHRQVMALRQQLEEVQFESMMAMREVLTAEQRSRLAQLMQQRRQTVRNRVQNRQQPQ